MNRGLEIKESHDFETHLNLRSAFTGSLSKISIMISSGRFGKGTDKPPVRQSTTWVSARLVEFTLAIRGFLILLEKKERGSRALSSSFLNEIPTETTVNLGSREYLVNV